jgi:hypothetical protein
MRRISRRVISQPAARTSSKMPSISGNRMGHDLGGLLADHSQVIAYDDPALPKTGRQGHRVDLVVADDAVWPVGCGGKAAAQVAEPEGAAATRR